MGIYFYDNAANGGDWVSNRVQQQHIRTITWVRVRDGPFNFSGHI